MEKTKIWVEVKKQLKLAGPLIFANALQYFLQTISSMFVGHLGELELSGAAVATGFAGVTGYSLVYFLQTISSMFVGHLGELAHSGAAVATGFAGVTGYSLVAGLAAALDTFCGQAYGAKQYRMLGIHMQRAMVVLSLANIPIAIMWGFTGQILKALKQDHQIAAEAGIYARWMIPSLFGFGLLQCYKGFLQTQNIVLPLLLAAFFTALLHILICWVLVFKLSFGSKGGALAISISYWINVLMLAAYVKLSPACKATWTGFSMKALRDIYNFLKLAIPSAIMICLEFWAFEVLVLLAGLLPNPQLTASVTSIILNTVVLVSMISIGLGANVSTRVSNELGAGNPQAARFAIFVAVSLNFIETMTVGAVLIGIRNVWGHAYSNDGDVVKHVAIIMPFVALFHVMDGIQCVLSGTARGCGWQKICVFVNLASFYIVGIPIAVLLAFVVHIGTKGLWIGVICGASAQALLLAIITLRTDWTVEVNKAIDRVNESTIPVQVNKASDRVNESTIPVQASA